MGALALQQSADTSLLAGFNLQEVVDSYECHYFTEANISGPDNLQAALKCPFIKLYSLGGSPILVSNMRKQFESNSRIHIFWGSHKNSFFELVRMIPSGLSTIFLLNGDSLERDLHSIAATRPAKRDVLLFTEEINYITPLFERTHQQKTIGALTALLPNRRGF